MLVSMDRSTRMNYRLFALQLVAVVALLPIGAFAQFTIEGVADRTMYNSAVQVRVPAQAGFDYAVTLNGTNFPAGVFVTVSRSDFYELRATRAGSLMMNRR
jgi:hypothetical protein